MCKLIGFVSLVVFVSAKESSGGVLPQSDLIIVPREGWDARPPTQIEPLSTPVPLVVIHHSYIPPACYNSEDCIKAMQWMQDFHQKNRSWADIGYNFAAGGDGRVYEGRGFTRVGAHSLHFNRISIGICTIGDWTKELPPENQMTAIKQLIAKGVKEGYIQSDYKLVGHRQVREGTECPGDRFFEEIKTWPHFTEDLSSVEEKLVEENRLKRKT